jgi:hypothetical protein
MRDANEIIRDHIRDKLAGQYKIDLQAVMNTPEGRRVFSYLLMDCGYRESLPQGNSKDIFNAGRRAVAVALTFACDSISDKGDLTGLNLRQLAEREYFSYQIGLKEEVMLEMDQKQHQAEALKERIEQKGRKK